MKIETRMKRLKAALEAEIARQDAASAAGGKGDRPSGMVARPSAARPDRAGSEGQNR